MNIRKEADMDSQAAVRATDGRTVRFPKQAVYLRKMTPDEIEYSDHEGDIYCVFSQDGQPMSAYTDTESALEMSADDGLIVLTLH